MIKKIKGLQKSFYYAISGILITLKTTRNLRIDILIAFYVLLFSSVAKISRIEYMIIFICFALVICSELINSAFESLCDIVLKSYSSHIKIAKDIAAGAVLMSAVFSVFVAGLIFLSGERVTLIVNALSSNIWLSGFLVLSLPVGIIFVFKHNFK